MASERPHILNGKSAEEKYAYLDAETKDDYKDDTICVSKICEYDWVLEERHSMTWRTYDDTTDKLNDYQLKVDESRDELNVITNSFRPVPPYDKKLNVYKDPNNHLSQTFTTDGRDNRLE